MAKNSPIETRTSRMTYCSRSLLPDSANSTNRFQSIPCPSIGGRAATMPHIVQFDFSANRVTQALATFVVPRGFIGDRANLVYLSSTVVPKPAYKSFSPYAFFNRANAGSPVQCPGAILCTFHFVFRFSTSASISSTGVVTRCNPPKTISVLGSTALAASRIASIPACEQPSTSSNPFDPLIASVNSGNSSVPFFCETVRTRKIPGNTSVNWFTNTKFPVSYSLPDVKCSGTVPPKYRIFAGKLSSARKNVFGIGAPPNPFAPSAGTYTVTFGFTPSTNRNPLAWSEWRCEITTKSSFVRSTPSAFTLCSNFAATFPVSNKILFPLCSTRAENPQSFVSSFDSPNAS